MYTKKQFGTDLMAELEQGYDPIRIAKWCYTKHLDERDLEDGLYEIIYEVYGMDAGPEFIIPQTELDRIARDCVSQGGPSNL